MSLALVLAAGGAARAQVTTAFTYQGQLKANGSPAEGAYDFRFILYDAEVGGGQVGPILDAGDVAVSGGQFTVELDFGATAFAGADRWLEVKVRPGASTGAYSTLSPRQQVTPTPYAITAESANGLRGRAVSANAPTNAQVLKWDDALMQWAPSADNDHPFSLPYSGSAASAVPAFSVANTGAGGAGSFQAAPSVTAPTLKTGTNGTGTAFFALNSGAVPVDSIPFPPANTAITAFQLGLNAGDSIWALNGGLGAALRARVDNTTSGADAVTASTPGTGRAGFFENTNTDNQPLFGVWGQCSSPNGTAAGVYGLATAGAANGVFGLTSSGVNNAVGVFGLAGGGGALDKTFGVAGLTTSIAPDAAGVRGQDKPGGAARTYGVLGVTDSTANDAAGVRGTDKVGGPGMTFGVDGQSNSIAAGAAGVRGQDKLLGAALTYGVLGMSNSTAAGAAGVRGFDKMMGGAAATYGVDGQTYSIAANAVGVRGRATAGAAAGAGMTYGVYGSTASVANNAAGVRGTDSGGAGATYGTEGVSIGTNPNAAAIRGLGNGAAGPGVPRAAALRIENGVITVAGPAKTADKITVSGWTCFHAWDDESDCNNLHYGRAPIGANADATITNSLIRGDSLLYLTVRGGPPSPGTSCYAQVLSQSPGTAQIRVTVLGGPTCQPCSYSGTVDVNYLIINPQ